MSSKFNPSATKSSYPPWCKTAPFIPPMIIVDGYPNWLTVYAHWVDLDPEAPADLSEAFSIGTVQPALEWYGESANAGTRLGLRATRDPDTDLWKLVFLIWDEWRLPETFEWLKIPAQQDDPLKIIAPVDVVIPVLDFRTCSVYG